MGGHEHKPGDIWHIDSTHGKCICNDCGELQRMGELYRKDWAIVLTGSTGITELHHLKNIEPTPPQTYTEEEIREGLSCIGPQALADGVIDGMNRRAKP